MFILEQSIAEWRKQMLAAGIKSPVPLEELESHLREEIERQTKLGRNEAEGFTTAVQKIGQPNLLTAEFKQTSDFMDFLRKHRALKVNHVIGLIWLVFYGNFLLKIGIPTLSSLLELKALIGLYIFLGGLIGSILLICDSKWGRYVIRMNALVFLLQCILGSILSSLTGGNYDRTYLGLFLTLCLVSILLLHLPRGAKSVISN